MKYTQTGYSRGYSALCRCLTMSLTLVLNTPPLHSPPGANQDGHNDFELLLKFEIRKYEVIFR